MSDAKRKFRSKGAARSRGKEPPATAGLGSEGRRKPRRSAPRSQGMDPFMMAGIGLAVLMAIGLLVVVSGRNKGVEDDVASNTNKKTATKGKKTKKKKKNYVDGNDPEVKAFLNVDAETRKQQAEDLGEMFIVMATVAKEIQPEMRPAQREFLETFKAHQSRELLRISDLDNEKEQARQRKLIESLRKATRACLKVAAKHKVMLKKAIRKSTLSAKLKTEMLKDAESGDKEESIAKIEEVAKLCALELKIISFIEKNSKFLKAMDDSDTPFSNSSLNLQYEKLRKQHARQKEKANAIGGS